MSLGYEGYGSLCNICSSSFWWLACLKQTKSTFCWGFPESMVAPYCKHFYVSNHIRSWHPPTKIAMSCEAYMARQLFQIKKGQQKQLFNGWKHVFQWLIPICKNKFSFNHRIIWGKKTSHKFLQKKHIRPEPGSRFPVVLSQVVSWLVGVPESWLWMMMMVMMDADEDSTVLSLKNALILLDDPYFFCTKWVR